jgi:hypothetical protein
LSNTELITFEVALFEELFDNCLLHLYLLHFDLIHVIIFDLNSLPPILEDDPPLDVSMRLAAIKYGKNDNTRVLFVDLRFSNQLMLDFKVYLTLDTLRVLGISPHYDDVVLVKHQ